MGSYIGPHGYWYYTWPESAFLHTFQAYPFGYCGIGNYYASTFINDCSNIIMEGDTSWADEEFEFSNSRKGTGVFYPCLELINNNDDNGSIDNDNKQEPNLTSIEILPNDVQERILSSLTIACIFKACCVCKKWNEIVHSKRFEWNSKNVSSNKPWYFMFTSSDEPLMFVYDSILRHWYNYELPFIVKHTWLIAPSNGLICFMDEESSSEFYICNPITRNFKKLNEPLMDPRFSIYSTVAFSVDRSTWDYSIAVVRTHQASDDFMQWDVSIRTYNSKESIWSTLVTGMLSGWRTGNVSMICGRVLYVLVFSTRTGYAQNSHGLLIYDLDNPKK